MKKKSDGERKQVEVDYIFLSMKTLSIVGNLVDRNAKKGLESEGVFIFYTAFFLYI